MRREEIFENRREVGKKLCEQIRQNDGQMINAKNFLGRPYYDGEKKYKFSTANYLRLISAENIYSDPRLYKIDDVEKNNWTLKSDANFELLAEESARNFEKSAGVKKYISPKIMVRTEDIFNQINLESENFQSAMKNFEQEKFRYFQSC